MMSFDRSIASLGFGITYFLQVVIAYLTTLSICAFVHNARLRVRIWGAFLVLDDFGLGFAVDTGTGNPASSCGISLGAIAANG
jgi:hypothetical protein